LASLRTTLTWTGRRRARIAGLLEREPAGGWLSLGEAEALLVTHGIPVAASHRCRGLDRAVAVPDESGGPVALKADPAAPAHASDIGAVLLGLEGAAVRSGWLVRSECAHSRYVRLRQPRRSSTWARRTIRSAARASAGACR